MTIAKRLGCPPILSIGISALLLAVSLPAQSRYLGELEGNHSVALDYSRLGSCTFVNRVRDATFTAGPGTFDIFPASAFSCQPFRFRDGRAEVNHPEVPVLVDLADPTVAPTVVNLSEPSDVTAGIALAGRAEFKDGGDVHAVRIGVEVGLDPATRQARDQLTCSKTDGFASSAVASRLIVADALCGVSVMDVVADSVKMGDVGGVMTVTEFSAVVESEFYIVMDHGSDDDGNSIGKGARLTYTIKSRYKFQLADDRLEISESSPDPIVPLLAASVNTFTAKVTFNLVSREMAFIKLNLFDKDGIVITSSPEKEVMVEKGMTEGMVEFSCLPPDDDLCLKDAMLPADGPVFLAAEMLDPTGNTILQSADIPYMFGMPADSLNVLSSTPDPTTDALKPGTPQDFEFIVSYQLQTKPEATIVAIALEQGGGELARSAEADAMAPDGTVDLSIPGVPLPDRESILIRIEMKDVDGNVLATEFVFYEYKPDYSIDHMEFVQTVQRENNTVPLVARKPAVVRVFVKFSNTMDATKAGVPLTLKGTRSGSELSGSPLSPINAGAALATKAPDRNNPAHSHDFLIPLAWLDRGTLTLEATANPGEAVPESNFDSNTLEQAFTLNQTRVFTVGYFPFCVQFPGMAAPACPTMAIDNMDGFMRKVYPVAIDGLDYSPVLLPPQIWRQPFVSNTGVLQNGTLQMFQTYIRSLFNLLVSRSGGLIEVDQLAAWLPLGFTTYINAAGNRRTRLGSADAVFAGNPGRTFYGVERINPDGTPTIPAQVTLAHEIGHNLGLRHPNTADACSASDGGTDWTPTRVNATIQQPGYDPRTYNFKDATARRDLMSYCRPQRWISDFHYIKLFNGRFLPRFLVSQTGPEPVAIVGGLAQADGAGGALDPIHQFEGIPGEPQSDPAGDYCVRLLGSGATLSDFCFSLGFRDPATDEELSEAGFSYVLRWPQGADQLVLFHQGSELASRAASAQPPAVEFVSPQAGEIWDAAQARQITWTAQDPDGDPLLYTLFYSADGGASWTPMALDLTEPAYLLDPSRILGGQVSFRVLASDGFHSTETVAGPVTVMQQPDLAVDGQPVQLGRAPVGGFIDGLLPIRNSGTGPLQVQSVVSDSGQFEVRDLNLPLLIPAGTSRGVNLRYTASAVALEQGTLTIGSDAVSGAETAVQIQGRGVDDETPLLRFEYESIAIDAVTVGELRNVPLTLRNDGRVPLEVSWTVEGEGFSAGTEELLVFTMEPSAQRDVIVEFAPERAGDLEGTLRLTTNDPEQLDVAVPLSGEAFEAPSGPRIAAGGIVDAAQFQPVLARGGIGSIFGSNMAGEVAVAGDTPLPTELAGASVEVNGVLAPLFFVSPAQFNFQMPFEAPPSGPVDIRVILDGEPSPPVSATLAEYGPAVFINPNTGEPIVQRHPDGALITAANPAQPGDVLITFVTGIGDVSNPPPSGAESLASPLARANLTPIVTVGGARGQVFFAGLAPFFVGLGQVNIQLPSDFVQIAALRTGADQGATLPLVIAFGESRSQPVNLPVTGVTVQPGQIDAGPVGLDFGDVTIGQSGDGLLTVRNVGGGPLTVSSITIDTARFSVASPPTPFSLAPGGQRTVTLRFQPAAAGPATGSALIGSDDPVNPIVTIPLLGNGVGGSSAASLSVSTTSLAFGSVNLGQSADLPLTVSNTGGTDLTVDAIMSSDPQFSPVFTGSPSGTPFTLAAGAELTIMVRFQPSAAGTHNGTLSVSNNSGSPTVNISLSGEGAGGGGAPGITLNSNAVTYGGVSVGRTNELTLVVTNSGGGPLTVESITSSDPQFLAASPVTPFVVPVGGQQNVKIHFTPSSLGSHSGTLTFASNDPAQPSVQVAVSGNGAEGAHVQFSDSFDRPNANCSAAPADNAFGGGGRHGYLPLFTTRGRPTGARLTSGVLENPGTDYAGVQFSGDEQPCLGGTGEDIGQDANIRVDLLVPSDSAGNISQAGLYFRTKSGGPGSSIIGGMSAGYWVQLHSTGQIKLKLLNPEDTVAATRVPASFNNTVMHTLEVSMRRDRLWVALDGVLQVFDQDGARFTSVPIPAVWERPPAVGVNEGAAGIAFGAEDNPDQIGGQRADNLVVTDYESLNELPVQE